MHHLLNVFLAKLVMMDKASVSYRGIIFGIFDHTIGHFTILLEQLNQLDSVMRTFSIAQHSLENVN